VAGLRVGHSRFCQIKVEFGSVDERRKVQSNYRFVSASHPDSDRDTQTHATLAEAAQAQMQGTRGVRVKS